MKALQLQFVRRGSSWSSMTWLPALFVPYLQATRGLRIPTAFICFLSGNDAGRTSSHVLGTHYKEV
jgi:hypothetical protein